MRVLHVIWSLRPATGGPPRVCTRLAAAQSHAGDQATILTNPLGEQATALQEMVVGFPSFDRVQICELDLLSWRAATLGGGAKGLARRLVNEHDIVHLHNVWDPILWMAARLARSAGIPYVVEPNGMLHPWALSQHWLKKRLALAVSFRRMLDSSGGLILGNENERALLAPLDLKAPVTVARLNAIFPEELEPAPPRGAFRARVLPDVGDSPLIVFLGRFHFKKGLDLLAEAFALHARNNPRTQLVMVGKDSGAEADFRDRIARAGLNRVHFVGELHGRSKWEALADAVCLVLPSRQEGFSVAITEAMACGLPVVITPDCHAPEVAEHDAGLVVSLEPAQIAAAFDIMVNNEVARARMSTNARRLVQTHFNYQAVGRVVDGAYRRAIAAMGLPAPLSACPPLPPAGAESL